MIAKLEKIAANFQRVMGAAGAFLNGFILFASETLGGNTGKLLSVTVIVFGIWLVGYGFYGQVRPVLHLLTTQNQTAEQMQQVSTTFNLAMSSIAVPLGVLVGAIPAIVGIGLMHKRHMESQSGSDEDEQPAPNIGETTVISGGGNEAPHISVISSQNYGSPARRAPTGTGFTY